MTGALSRLALTQAAAVRQLGFEAWIEQLVDGKIMEASVVRAKVEYSESVNELTETGHSESFPLSIRAIVERDANSAWNAHKGKDTVSQQDYLHSLHRALGVKMGIPKRLYLDTNFWVNLRNVVLGRTDMKGAGYACLLSRIRDLRARGRIICPISFPLFQELVRQSDNQTRRTMAALMDELSDGTCIQTPDTIEKLELKRLFLKTLLGPKAPEMQEWVWTKVGAVCGEWLITFPSKVLPQADVNLLQKVMIDEMWGMSVSALVEFYPVTDNPAMNDLAASYQALAKDYRQHKTPFENILEDEKVRHTNILLSNSMKLLLEEIQRQFPAECSEFKANQTHAQQFDPKALASIQIKSAIHASFISQTPTMILEANDIIDAVHAATALPYFDAVCVDRGLSHRLKTAPLNFNEIYSATVLSSPDELLGWLAKF